MKLKIEVETVSAFMQKVFSKQQEFEKKLKQVVNELSKVKEDVKDLNDDDTNYVDSLNDLGKRHCNLFSKVESSQKSLEKYKKETVLLIDDRVNDVRKEIEKAGSDSSLCERVKKVELTLQSNGKVIEKVSNSLNEVEAAVKSNGVQETTGLKDLDSRLKSIDEKIKDYDTEIKNLELKISERQAMSHKKKTVLLKCTVCEQMFRTNSELENHLTTHPEATPFPCAVCGKILYSEWRMTHHLKGHQVEKKRKCHFFNNNKFCPYEKLGCKFAHKPSKKCKFAESCKETLCQFQHVSQLMR